MNELPAGRFGVALDVTLDLPLASLGSRALAQLLDMVLLQTVQASVVLAGLGIAALSGLAVEDAPRWVLALLVVVVFCLQWGWFAGWELAWEGQTPGKRLLRLRVVSDDGGTPGALAILLRNLLRTVDFFPGGYLLGVLVMFFHPQAKRVGDLAAGTVVVSEARAPERRRRWPAGLRPAELRLLGSWLDRRASLAPDRRALLAAKLVDRLRETNPELLAGAPEDPEAALLAVCPEEG